MFGSFVKYSLVAIGGAIALSVCMHASDDAAELLIAETIKEHEVLKRKDGLEGEELRQAMRDFIATNRKAWDSTYLLAGTGRDIQAIYDAWN